MATCVAHLVPARHEGAGRAVLWVCGRLLGPLGRSRRARLGVFRAGRGGGSGLGGRIAIDAWAIIAGPPSRATAGLTGQRDGAGLSCVLQACVLGSSQLAVGRHRGFRTEQGARSSTQNRASFWRRQGEGGCGHSVAYLVVFTASFRVVLLGSSGQHGRADGERLQRAGGLQPAVISASADRACERRSG